MWHEARKQEKKIRGMLVDYKKRAERRKDYYDKIKLDPTQFIQIHGRRCKIHIDPSIHHAAELPGSMMPWRGDTSCIIDRFDVRAHLDDIPRRRQSTDEPILSQQERWEERQANYERYRILIQNEFLEIKEEKFLQQIRSEELYGPVVNKSNEEIKKSLAATKAAIPYAYSEYDDSTTYPSSSTQSAVGEDSDDSASDLDLDLNVDVNLINDDQCSELNEHGLEYGLAKEDFMNFMKKDLKEVESLKLAKAHEDEKAMYSGRKSRKERRALKKKHLDRKLTMPSYAARASPTYQSHAMFDRSSSHSKSPSPEVTKVKYITSFGNESDSVSSDDGIVFKTSETKPDRYDDRKSRSSYQSRDHRDSRRSSSSTYSRSEKSKSYESNSCKGPRSGTSQSSVSTSEPPRSRYYGRRGGSTESDSDSSPPRKKNKYGSTSTSYGKDTPADKVAPSESTLMKEKLKKKMQVLLKKQYKADKKMEKEKAERAEQERQEREEELRGIADRMRQKEKERRRLNNETDSDSSSSASSRSPSPRARKSYR